MKVILNKYAGTIFVFLFLVKANRRIKTWAATVARCPATYCTTLYTFENQQPKCEQTVLFCNNTLHKYDASLPSYFNIRSQCIIYANFFSNYFFQMRTAFVIKKEVKNASSPLIIGLEYPRLPSNCFVFSPRQQTNIVNEKKNINAFYYKREKLKIVCIFHRAP